MTSTNDATIATRPVAVAAFDEGLRRHMLRVYNYMTVGLIITGAVAYGVSTTPALYGPLYASPLVWVVTLAPLLFVFALSLSINTISATAAQVIFWAFAAVMGLSLSSVFLVFTGTSIARTFFTTAAMFGAMSLFGYTTKTDLTRFGSFLIMGVFGILIASIVNLFVGSDVFQFAISIVGILVFLGLTAWDTQAIKAQYAEGQETAASQKLAVMGALSLYLSFLNIFQFLLILTGSRQE